MPGEPLPDGLCSMSLSFVQIRAIRGLFRLQFELSGFHAYEAGVAPLVPEPTSTPYSPRVSLSLSPRCRETSLTNQATTTAR